MSRLPARAAVLLLLTGVLAVGAPGCTSRPAPHTWRIVIRDMAFDPPPQGIRVGDTIEWVNQDMFQHTATARDGRFDVDLPPGAKASSRVQTAGMVEVYCRYHPGMKLRLSVAG